MWLIPGAVMALVYAFTSDGHPNGLLFLAIILIVLGVIFQMKQTDKTIDRIIVETLDVAHDMPAATPPKNSGSFEVDESGRIRNVVMDGITVDDEGNITAASPQATAVLFEILDLVASLKQDHTGHGCALDPEEQS